jgi:hypothetical protein
MTSGRSPADRTVTLVFGFRFTGHFKEIFSPGRGTMGKKLTGDLAGIAPCAWSSGEFPVLSEKI